MFALPSSPCFALFNPVVYSNQTDFTRLQVVDEVIAHMQSWQPPSKDYRAPMRLIEQELLTEYAPKLIAEQAHDFHKQVAFNFQPH
jgi:hypothetical protein